MNAWFLPVNEDGALDKEVHKNMKLHYFVNDKSLCGKYRLDTDYYETNIDDNEITNNHSIACKKCYKKWVQSMK